jgi:hypothetical protein
VLSFFANGEVGMWKLNVAECFCFLVVGEECPITGVHIFFWSQLLHCVM